LSWEEAAAEGPACDQEAPRIAAWEAFSVEDVRRALMFVPPSFRAAYALLTFDHLSYAEIGRRLSLTPGTVASRVFRARQHLREVLTSGEFRLRAVEAAPGKLVAPSAPVGTRKLGRVRQRARDVRVPQAAAVAFNGWRNGRR
jgi:hypothetical protein